MFRLVPASVARAQTARMFELALADKTNPEAIP
jgi:hypothetical protein